MHSELTVAAKMDFSYMAVVMVMMTLNTEYCNVDIPEILHPFP